MVGSDGSSVSSVPSTIASSFRASSRCSSVISSGSARSSGFEDSSVSFEVSSVEVFFNASASSSTLRSGMKYMFYFSTYIIR